MREDYHTGLDLGSQSIKVVVGQGSPDGAWQVIGASQETAHGITKGSISSIDDAVSSLSAALEAAERIVGQPLTHATVGISGVHVASHESRGVVAVSRADGEVREEDLDRVIDAAQAVATPPNHEILHVIPLEFIVDNQRGIKDPVGMSGVRLEVVTQLVQILSSEIKNTTKTVYRSGLEINDLVLSVLACAESTLTKRQKELGVALINIGAATTSVAVFEEGDMLFAGVIPIGSAHLTSDLAIGLRTSIDVAEQVKLALGRVKDKKVGKRDEVKLSEFSSQESGKLSVMEVMGIIDARLEEIFDHVNDNLSKIQRAGRLPAGVVLTGGGAKLPGIIEAARDHFKLPAALGKTEELVTTIEKAKGLEFTTALGLALWDRHWRADKQSSVNLPGLNSVKNLVGNLRSKLRNLIG